MKTNKKAKDDRVDRENRLAGGYGPGAAKQDAEGLLRRSVMACLLWENNFYESGVNNAENIKELIPQVEPEKVRDIAIEARTKQKLRHVPLYIAREMARLDTHKHLVGDLLPQIIKRADEITEFMALYWKEGKCPISKQVKLGLAEAFKSFNEYQLAKYNRKTEIKLRDVMFLVHPNPGQKSNLFKKLAEGNLETPDTWEVALSSGKDKKEQWTRLIEENKLGALAFMRNLRNMEESGVAQKTILEGFKNINSKWLLPLNYLAAAQNAPKYTREIENLMFKNSENMEKLPGYTIFVVDVSGSMHENISSRSKLDRLDAACAMAMIASEACEHITVYVTAGNDSSRKHKTKAVAPLRGFGLMKEIKDSYVSMGGGGIFTRQCLEYIKSEETEKPDRIIIFSDSQDCDFPSKSTPRPFGKKNYICDVSSHRRGINYARTWTAEIAGWSEHFMNYIMGYEGLEIGE